MRTEENLKKYGARRFSKLTNLLETMATKRLERYLRKGINDMKMSECLQQIYQWIFESALRFTEKGSKLSLNLAMLTTIHATRKILKIPKKFFKAQN